MKIRSQPPLTVTNSQFKQSTTQKPNQESFLSLKEVIAAIQQSQEKQGIKSLAASLTNWEKFELDIIIPEARISRARQIGTKKPVDWADFWYLDGKLYDEWLAPTGNPRVVTAITQAMKTMIQNATSYPLVKYSDSRLMKVANGTYSKIGPFKMYSCSHEARVNAAIALRIIVEKIGNSLNDEINILRMLLVSDIRDVREQGIIAAENTWKHHWRKNTSESGLCRRLRLEPDQALRGRATWIIVQANPKALLEACTKDDGSKYFPIELIAVIDNPSIRSNMFFGLCSLFSAQRKEGKFYDNFKEIPVLDASDIERCFKYSIHVLQDLVNKSTLSVDERQLLHNTCFLISSLLDKDLNPVVKCLDLHVYDDYVNKVSSINLSKFIEHTTHSHFTEDSWKDKNTWIAARKILEMALSVAGNRCKNPLANYLLLRDDVERMKTNAENTPIPHVASNLNNVLDIIDSSIESYLVGKNLKGIIWQDTEELSAGFPRLLQLLTNSRNVSCRLAVLNTIDSLTQDGIAVAQRSLPFNAIINEQNMAGLVNVLRNNVYFKSV